MAEGPGKHQLPAIKSRKDLLRYRALLDALNDPFAVVDENNFLSYVNEKFANLLEYTADEMISRKTSDFLDDENKAKQRQALKSRASGSSSQYELEWITKSGSKRQTIVSGVPIFSEEGTYRGSFAVITDISDRILAEEKYRVLAEQSIQGLTIIQDDRYKYVNPAFSRIVGYTVEEITEMTPETAWSLIYEEDRNYLLRLAEDRRAGRKVPMPYEYRFVRRDGSIRWVQAYASLIEYEGKTATQVLIIDITDAKVAESKLRASQEMLTTIIGTIPQFVFWKDVDSVYLGCNENFARVSGIDDPDEIVGKTDFELPWRKEEAERLRRIDKKVIRDNSEESSVVMTQKQADGREAWIELSVVPLHDEDEKVIGVLGSYEDITEKRQAEDRLRKSEGKYRSLAEQSVQGITILDNEKLVYYNQAFKDLVGYSTDKLDDMTVGQVWKIVHPEDRDEVRKRMTNKIAGRDISPKFEYRFVRMDGSIRWVESFSTKVDYEGKPAVQTLIVDITDRIESERELGSAKERAMLYLDIMAHDLAQQLQVIQNSAALMSSATEDSIKDSFQRVIADAVKKCSRLISGAKSTEMLLSVPLQERSLGAAVGTCVEALSDRTEGVSFEMKIQVVDSNVWADEFLELLLTQILMNAVEHNKGKDKRVWVTLSETETGFIVSIADNGPGIPDSIKGGLFDMSRRYGGFGLHTANQIVEKYQGRIEVHDRVLGDHAKGAEFRIWIPKHYKPSE